MRPRPFADGAPDTVARFNARAGDYARFRPSYPEAAIEAILHGLRRASDARPTVVDVGAGTGISTALLAAAGARTIGVEPNDEMRAVACEAGLDVRPGTAIVLPLADGEADAIACFQSFHWFASREVLGEFARVLRPSGRVALVWNERDDGHPFTRGYGEAVDKFGKRTAFASYSDAAAMLRALLPAGPFATVRALVVPNAQRLDREGLFGRVRSTSYAPREGPEHTAMVDALGALFEQHCDAAGTIEIRYHTEVYLLDKGDGSRGGSA